MGITVFVDKNHLFSIALETSAVHSIYTSINRQIEEALNQRSELNQGTGAIYITALREVVVDQFERSKAEIASICDTVISDVCSSEEVDLVLDFSVVIIGDPANDYTQKCIELAKLKVAELLSPTDFKQEFLTRKENWDEPFKEYVIEINV